MDGLDTTLEERAETLGDHWGLTYKNRCYITVVFRQNDLENHGALKISKK